MFCRTHSISFLLSFTILLSNAHCEYSEYFKQCTLKSVIMKCNKHKSYDMTTRFLLIQTRTQRQQKVTYVYVRNVESITDISSLDEHFIWALYILRTKSNIYQHVSAKIYSILSNISNGNNWCALLADIDYTKWRNNNANAIHT